MNDHQQITAERGRRAADLRAAAVALLEQQTIAAGVMLDLDSDQVVAAGPKSAILYLLSNGAPATASGDELPPLPEPIEVGGEGWDFEDFKSWKTFTVEQMEAYARAAVSAATKPTADLSAGGLLKMWKQAEADATDTMPAPFQFARSLLATKPAAAPAVPEGFVIVPINPTPAMNRAAVEYINGTGIYSISLAPTVLEIEESIYHEVYRAMLAAAPAASTTGAAQTAEQVRDQALEDAAEICDDRHHNWRFGDGEDSVSGPKECAAAIRALKRPTPTHSSEAGDA